MDTLLLISGELLLLPMLLAAAVLFEIVSGFLLALVQLFLRPLQRQRARQPGIAGRLPGLGLLRRLRSMLVSLCTAVLLLAIAADTFFFESALRWVFDRAESYAGIHVDFEEAEGSFIGGRVELHGLTATRDDGESNAISVQAEQFTLDVAMLEVLSSTKRVQKLSVVGLTGSAERRRVGKSSGVRRQFVVDDLSLERIDMTLVDQTRDEPIELRVEVDSLTVSPLRSNMMLFDLMYRTNAKGRVSGYAFEATSVESESSRVTTWRAPEIPLSLAMPYLGSGARFIEGGSVDVSVEDRWVTTEPVEISMHYRIVLRDLQVAIPEDLGPTEKALALPLALAVKKLGKEIPLEFSLELDEEQFEGAVSLEAIGLWQAASGALADAMMKESGVEPDDLKKWGTIGKGLLNRALDD